MSDSIVASLILGGIGVIITFYYNRLNAKLAHDKMRKQLFTEFNKRYNKLNDYLVEIERACTNLQGLEENPRLLGKLMDYFNLCAEEYYWYKKGRIDDIIWNSWHAGMNEWYNKSTAIKEAWAKEMENGGHQSSSIKRRNDFFVNA